MSPVLYDSDRALVSDDVDRVNELKEAFAANFINPNVGSLHQLSPRQHVPSAYHRVICAGGVSHAVLTE